jgi:hypothetical protein
MTARSDASEQIAQLARDYLDRYPQPRSPETLAQDLTGLREFIDELQTVLAAFGKPDAT